MHTSSSAKRTCSDSRSASEYTATVWIPSSRQARITRSAISPRFAIRTFLNIQGRYRRGRSLLLLERAPALVARSSNTLHTKREFRRTAGVEHGTLVRDDALRIPLHQRLVEGLHAVLDRAFLDEVRNVERFLHVANLI